LQRFLRLVHGMQGVSKQFAFLLHAVVFTKVPASLYHLCKTHWEKKSFLFSWSISLYYCIIVRHIVQSTSNSWRLQSRPMVYVQWLSLL
jgi:hypothetical protein